MKFRPIAFAFEIFQTIIVIAGAAHRAAPDGITEDEALALGYVAVRELIADMKAGGVKFADAPPAETEDPEVVEKAEARRKRVIAAVSGAHISPRIRARVLGPKAAPVLPPREG